MKKIVFLPIETESRELDKKVNVLNEINSKDMNLNFITKDLFFLSSEK